MGDRELNYLARGNTVGTYALDSNAPSGLELSSLSLTIITRTDIFLHHLPPSTPTCA